MKYKKMLHVLMIVFEMWFFFKPIKILNKCSENELSQKKIFRFLKIIEISKRFVLMKKCVNSLPVPYVMIFLDLKTLIGKTFVCSTQHKISHLFLS